MAGERKSQNQYRWIVSPAFAENGQARRGRRVRGDNQRGRRSLADIDRISLAERRREIVARKAKANQEKTGKNAPRNPKGQLQPVWAILPKPVNTRAELAKLAGVGGFVATPKKKKAVVSDNRKGAYSSVSKHIYLQAQKCVSLGYLLVFWGF